MWYLLIFVFLTIPLINAQGERSRRPFDNGHGWDIRLAVPGQPDNDYPTLNSIPRTSFTCSGKEPGYYADIETNCQVFRVCTLGSTYGFQSFLCPNGTLFNQEVFVCDWWMNVNCQKTKEIINNNNEKFKNLKLGPQFMSDIKKMITHPIRNPYDRSNVKNNLVFMQVYKPPLGQLYNEALLKNLERNTNDIYAKKKQVKSYQDPFTTDITSAASTPTTQYIPNYIFQNQLQSRPYSQQQSLTSNAHSGQTSQTRGQNMAYYNNYNIQSIRSPIFSHSKAQIKTYNNSSFNKNKETLFGLEFSKQRVNKNINKENQLYTDQSTQSRYSKDTVGQIDTETKQNLVSKDSPPTLITKTLAFRKIIKDSKDGTPKSRITFKTWIVRPSKAAKITADTTSYTYNKPQNYVEDIANANLDIKDNDESYKYDHPKNESNETSSTAKEIPDLITSTSSPSVSTTPLPTKESLIYVSPTTFNPLQFTYLPPDVNSNFLSRQYLLPNIANNQLVAAGSSPSPFFKLPLEINKNEPKFSVTKHSHINSNNNNLSFSDILTKEKLDISVNDIVKETNNILQTVSTEQFTKLGQNVETVDFSVENYLPFESNPQSNEQLTLQRPSPLPQNSRLIAIPSSNLEPPIEDFTSEVKVSNKLSKLPYIKESQPNTIERMVSLKITLPENIAKYLFQNTYNNNSSNIEILNTENSNYLVLANKLATNAGANFIPIGRLSKSKTKNISDSQDLVFSLLADSINAAKEYSNIAQHNILYPPPTQQFQNIQNDQLQQISQDISRLTSSQFSATNPTDYRLMRSNTIKTTNSNLQSRNRENNNLLSNFTNSPKQQTPQDNLSPSQNRFYSANSDNIYSGQLYQLPVPEVTKQIYNSPVPSISNYILSTNLLPTNSQIDTSHRHDQRNSNEVEIIPSQIIPTSAFQSTTHLNEQVADQGSAANAYVGNFRIPTNAIRAQVHDNVIGTIPHPLEQDKWIKYKKDQSYYIYTHLNNYDEDSSNNGNTIDANQESKEYADKGKVVNPSFQLLPSLGYKLEDEKEKQNILNIFQLDKFGNPTQNTFPNSDKSAVNIERRQDISTDVDFTVSHPTSSSNVNSPNYLSALYDGPSSYSAPQSSVGSLTDKQNYQSDSRLNANLEKFDTIDNSNGYPKVSPLKKFLF